MRKHFEIVENKADKTLISLLQIEWKNLKKYLLEIYHKKKHRKKLIKKYKQMVI